ncbi:MAG: hypothetical protein KatS3mg110_1787 [Pirellulaceae bacterium]|nr:MAG: hypothetical protein KatS3mg110_1787 [Pirellulaceae bacterium]
MQQDQNATDKWRTKKRFSGARGKRMSLFERTDYFWRETYFVFFREKKRPKTADLKRLVRSLGERFELVEAVGDQQGYFESLTLLAPADFAGLDVVYCRGEDIDAEKHELIEDLERTAASAQAKHKLELLRQSDARFEVFHFEHVVPDDEEEYDELERLDPGGLLTLLAKLAEYTGGVIVDPQAAEFL